MKIKKLSIIGFKSFMDKLEIGLPMGISAIVGPNGCGKSNIVDAIRWAMGEQSAKLLRGRQMEDVIFNGAGDSKPLGMAEVSVIFENGDGSFPTEFAHESEISVTRRLYRSGESEYLINRVPCRLKDVQEIFMDTGLGNKAYSIIGQGRIGYIIDQRPDETRVMLEEAAGITKYKKKVDESQRKIELTKANLERVEDILIEVQRQMRSLKRQASKARRFKSIGQEIQRLELILNANSYQELKEESGNRMKSTEDLVQEEIARSTDFSGIQARVETMNLALEEKDEEISQLRGNFLTLKEEVNRKESALESLAGDKRMQVSLESRLKNEKEDIRKRLGGLDQEKTVLREKIENIDKNAATLESEISLFNQRVKSKRELLTEAKEEYERAKTRVNSGVTKEMGLNQESGYLNKMINEITDSRARLEREKNDVGLKTEDILRASKRKSQTRAALNEKLMGIEGDIVKERERCDELGTVKKAIERDLKLAEADLSICQSRLTSLRSLTENFEGYKLGVRTIMKANDLEARRDGRVIGLVADIIQVEPQFEQAVEAVLADKLQYIIVERQQDGKEAVNYLKIKAKGRSSFVPLVDLNGGKEYNGKNNGFPLLRNLVTVPDSYRNLIDTLLGDAAIVEDLDQAISVWGSNGKDQCLVTAEGDMVDNSGVISGGKLAHSSHGLLARKREIKELEKNVAKHKKGVEGFKGKLETVTFEIEERETSLHVLMEEKSDCQEKINDFDKVIFRLGHELDQLERLTERISGELDQKIKEEARKKDTLTRVESELKLCMEKRRQEEEYLRQKEVELKEIEEEFEQFQNELARLKMDYTLSQEEKRGLSREIDRIDDFSDEAQQKLKRIDEEILIARNRYEEVVEKEGVLKEKLNETYGRQEQAEETLNQAEQERSSFQHTIREEEDKGRTIQGELEILREKINRARLEQSEIKFKMNSLVELVKEKFNINLLEIYREYLEDDFSPLETKERLEHQKRLKERLGEVNLTAIQEHEALKERHTFITAQKEDLLHSIDSLNKAIKKINKMSREKFMTTFEDVDKKLKEVFPILFNGGTAGLKLIDETDPLESGVLVVVQPPGKKLSHMGLLSGGEKALVAMALLFAIYLIKPSPFCLLDEVDAPLDEANIDRFNDLMKEIKKYSQIILVTHNRRSMEIVDRLYGVTMERAGVSKLVSVNLQGLQSNQETVH